MATQSGASSMQLDREGTLVTENFGGLNTEASPNDLPDGDSPSMMNVEVNTNGLIVKRRGTNWRQQHTVSGYRDGRGHTIIPHKLKDGTIVVCEKLQTGLRWGVLPRNTGGANLKSGGITSIGLMPNVFSTRAANSRASWVITPDPIPRIILATGENTVVEVALYEQQITTTGASVGSMVINDNVLGHTRFHTVTGTTYTVIISSTGTVTTVTSTSRSGKNVTLNFSGTLVAGTYTIFRPVWSFWVDSLVFSPEQLYDYVVHPASIGDSGGVHFPQPPIEIPEPLRRGITPFNYNGDRPYTMYNNSVVTPTLNTWNQSPGTSDTEHAYSSGVGSQAAANTVQSGDTHLVFGRASTGASVSQPARYIHITRAYNNIFFDGINQLRAFEISSVQNPYSAGVGRFIQCNPISDAGSPTAGQYWFATNQQFYRGYDTNFGFTAAGGSSLTIGNTRLGYFGMSGSYPFGINDGCMSFTRRIDIGGSSFLHIGTDRTLEDDGYTVGTNNVLKSGASSADYQGAFLPISGLWEFCEFKDNINYDFPSIVAYYQGRLVLSGFKHNPNLVAFSNVTNNYEWFTNSYEREVNRNFGTLYSDLGLGYSPLQVFLDIDTSEKVTNIVSTNDALICFTQNNTIAITGTNGANIIPSAYIQNKISKVGCVNQKCAVNTELGVIFLSRSGVYFLKPVQETGAYSTVNLSLKIQRIIDSSTFKNEDVAWMTYDQAKSTVFVGISDGSYSTSCSRLLVLNLLRNAWTEYGLTGGYWFSNDGAYIDSRVLVDFNIWADRTTAADNSGNSVNILELYGFHFLDWAFVDVGNNFTGTYSTPIPNHTQYITLDANQRAYSSAVGTSYQVNAVRPIPMRQVLEQDFVNVNTVTRYNDWISIVGNVGGTNQSSEVSGDFSTLQVDKAPYDNFVFADSVTFTTGHVLRCRLREYNNIFDTKVPIHVYIDNVELNQTGSPNFTVLDPSGTTTYSITPSASYTSNQIVFVGAGIPCWWFSPMWDREQNNRIKRATHIITQFRNRDQQLWRPSDRNVAAGQSSAVLSDKFKYDVNANLGILYDNSFDSSYQMDLFQVNTNLDTFSTDVNKTRRDLYSRIVSPIVGSSHSIQMCVFSFDASYFELSAYQVVTVPKGRSARSIQDIR